MTQPRDIPIYLIPPDSPDTDLAHFVSKNDDKWSIEELAKFGPMYFYQDNVEPTPEGGHVKTQKFQSKRKQNFISVDKDFKETIEEQSFTLKTNDDHIFTSLPMKKSSDAILIDCGDHYELHLIDIYHEIKQEQRDILLKQKSYEDVKKENSERNRAREKFLKERMPQYREKLLEKDKQREQEMKEEAKNDRHFNIRANSDNSSEDETDSYEADIEEEDKEEISDDLLDLEMEEPISFDEEEAEEEDEPQQSQKVKKSKVNNDEPLQNDNDIIDRIAPLMVQEKDIFMLFQNSGSVYLSTLYQTFKEKLKTAEQKNKFRNLLKKMICQVKLNEKATKNPLLKLKPNYTYNG